MAKFNLSFKAAKNTDPHGARIEYARILREVADRLELGDPLSVRADEGIDVVVQSPLSWYKLTIPMKGL